MSTKFTDLQRKISAYDHVLGDHPERVAVFLATILCILKGVFSFLSNISERNIQMYQSYFLNIVL